MLAIPAFRHGIGRIAGQLRADAVRLRRDQGDDQPKKSDAP
ncbi:MAG TPA: hypothetical protein VLC46_20845 [Thermoanaerobaculia bacterium]|jgi:hypothetical protein|nr:hypothetical protein [Thermoanaerobaculia bacterium]